MKTKSSTTARADAKLQNMPPATLDELWTLRHPEVEGDRVWTLTEIAAWVPGRFGFEIGKSAVGEFYQWLELKRRIDHAAASAQQARMTLAHDKNITEEDLERVAQCVFTAEALGESNIKGYVAMARLKLQREAQAIEKEKISAAGKSKIESGLEALYQEIRGNPKAEKLFAELKSVVEKA